MMNMMSAGNSLASSVDLHTGESNSYLRIGDVAKQFGVTLRTLRFYEDKGLITPLRDGNSRLYSRRDLVRLRLILLGRQVGFTLREVKQMMDLYDPANGNARQLRVVVEKSERQLSRLRKQREEIDQAIDALKGLVEGARSNLGNLKAA
jgi:DNA-binding transcriptional MerR regulator